MITFSAQTIERVELDAPSVGFGERYGVIIHNNSTTPMDVVIAILMLATKCSLDEAVIETMEAHTLGKAWVHFSSEDECRRIAQIIERVGVETTVKKEWD
jgi:ATP-dependent Clp protease adapter protein ClpS